MTLTSRSYAGKVRGWWMAGSNVFRDLALLWGSDFHGKLKLKLMYFYMEPLLQKADARNDKTRQSQKFKNSTDVHENTVCRDLPVT